MIKITDVFDSHKSTVKNHGDAELFALKNSARIVFPTPFEPKEVQKDGFRLVDFNDVPSGPPGTGLLERRYRDYIDRMRKYELEQKPKPVDDQLRGKLLPPAERPGHGPSPSP